MITIGLHPETGRVIKREFNDQIETTFDCITVIYYEHEHHPHDDMYLKTVEKKYHVKDYPATEDKPESTRYTMWTSGKFNKEDYRTGVYNTLAELPFDYPNGSIL
jgi:hypothetical protein